MLGSVSWESIEPQEGVFDFSELDKVVLGARKHGLHLVILWFGSYKNGMSSYAPAWVKKDYKRFPRVHINDENLRLKSIEVLSPLSQATWEADARAFTALLRHIKEVDKSFSTVMMVQVESECGILGDSRDRNKLYPEFERKFPNFRTAVSARGPKTWEHAFGKRVFANGLLMVRVYANFLGKVAKAGKKEYPLHMFANVWLNTDSESIFDGHDLPAAIGKSMMVGGGTKPGLFPSGGPCSHTMDIYRFCATDLDMLTPAARTMVAECAVYAIEEPEELF
ncbi:hypothetical protein NCS55_00768000 [Fusarium keratoplasticum]|nr:hypothetical protein NCS55_00768000 [Fusarium keratoplasticum]